MMSALISRVRFLRFLRVHMRSRIAIERWQAKRLKKLLVHALKNIAVYKNIYGNRNFTDALLSVAVLAELPTVSKHDFIGKVMEDYTDNSSALEGVWASTSGTSGHPFTVLKRPMMYEPLYRDVLQYRFLLWKTPWRFDLSGVKIARIKVRYAPRKNRLSLSVRDLLVYEQKVFRQLMRFQPEVIESYASILYLLAQKIVEKRLPIRPRYVVSMGEQISAGLRAYITQALGCEVFDRYGLEEFGVVATECDIHDGMHINCESLIVEVVDDAGRPLPDGERGRIVVTDLFNYSMPFIRYETGDHGSLSWDLCPCGLRAPRIWIEGRYAAYLSFGNRRVHHLEFDAALDSFMNVILQYQVVKRTEDEAVVRVVCGNAFDDDACTRIILAVKELVGNEIKVSVDRVESIPLTPRGKSKIVVDETVV